MIVAVAVLASTIAARFGRLGDGRRAVSAAVSGHGVEIPTFTHAARRDRASLRAPCATMTNDDTL